MYKEDIMTWYVLLCSSTGLLLGKEWVVDNNTPHKPRMVAMRHNHEGGPRRVIDLYLGLEDAQAGSRRAAGVIGGRWEPVAVEFKGKGLRTRIVRAAAVTP